MIPKIIHYCWFGNNDKRPLENMCIKSWKKYLPDYKFMEWNEDNFDISKHKFAHEAYLAGQYAFTSDVCRLVALKEYGGIYLDTDIELLKNIPNSLLERQSFIGRETNHNLGIAFVGTVVNGEMVSDLLDQYSNLRFKRDDGRLNLIPIPKIVTSFLVDHKGLQLNNTYQKLGEYCDILPIDYCYPKDIDTRKVTITKNTICIHHYSGSWIPTKNKLKLFLNKFLGKRNVENIIFFVRKIKGEY